MTTDEKYNALNLVDIENIIEPVCEKCPVAENCYGCLSPRCPFSSKISDVIERAYDMQEALQEAICFAENYEEYCNDMKNDIHRPSRDVA